MVQPNSENLLLNGTSPIFCSADLLKNPCRFTVGISLIDPGRLMLSIATKDTTWFRIGSVCFGDGASSNHGTGESEQPLQKHQVFPFQSLRLWHWVQMIRMFEKRFERTRLTSEKCSGPKGLRLKKAWTTSGPSCYDLQGGVILKVTTMYIKAF